VTKLLRFSMAALTALAALAFTTASADEKCENLGSPGTPRAELSKPCSQQGVQAGTLPGESGNNAGSASAEPAASSNPEGGYDASGNVDPGYYVSDWSESQFLLDTWTMAGG
jgi:hypothetical protein